MRLPSYKTDIIIALISFLLCLIIAFRDHDIYMLAAAFFSYIILLIDVNLYLNHLRLPPTFNEEKRIEQFQEMQRTQREELIRQESPEYIKALDRRLEQIKDS